LGLYWLRYLGVGFQIGGVGFQIGGVGVQIGGVGFQIGGVGVILVTVFKSGVSNWRSWLTKQSTIP